MQKAFPLDLISLDYESKKRLWYIRLNPPWPTKNNSKMQIVRAYVNCNAPPSQSFNRTFHFSNHTLSHVAKFWKPLISSGFLLEGLISSVKSIKKIQNKSLIAFCKIYHQSTFLKTNNVLTNLANQYTRCTAWTKQKSSLQPSTDYRYNHYIFYTLPYLIARLKISEFYNIVTWNGSQKTCKKFDDAV